MYRVTTYKVMIVVTNELVNNNEHCLNLVRDAIEFIDSKKNRHFFVKPRESYSESTPVIVTRLRGVLPSEDFFVCYFPREEKWTKFPAEEHVPPTEHVVSWYNILYMSTRGQTVLLRFVLQLLANIAIQRTKEIAKCVC